MKSKNRSLLFILTKSYLLFTLTLFMIVASIYWGWDTYLNRIYAFTDWDALISDTNLKEGHYQKLLEYLREQENKFAVLDIDGEIIFLSEPHWDIDFTLDEISCIKEYGSDIFTNTFYCNENGRIFYQVLKYEINSDSVYVKIADMSLDENYRVIEGGLQEGKKQYTKREFELLTDRFFMEANFYRYPFVSSQGEQRILLFTTDYFNSEDAAYFYQESWKIWLLFVPLYIVFTIFFIWRLRKNILTPLNRLHRAVVDQARGQSVSIGNYDGPHEIAEIGKSFEFLTRCLAESEQERKRLDQERQKLIADISHDLKTPITVIAGYVNALCDGKVPPGEEQNYLTVIQNRAKTLTELINAFHEYSKVEHPEFTLCLERTDMCEYFRTYLIEKYNEIELAGFSLEITIPEAPVFCRIDKFQLRRAFDNLLSNALRYNQLGTLLFFDLLEDTETVTLIFADNGKGIPKEKIHTIFEPFVVGNDARSNSGSGLGLAITQRVVELHGGSIALSADPTLGRNSEFIIKLPKA